MSLSLRFPKPMRLRSQYPRRSGVVFTLPTELWDAVFQHLTADRDLLATAAVCATFNALCIGIYLVKNNISAPFARVPSDRIHALQLACTLPPITHLICKFRSDNQIHRDLMALRTVVRRSNTLCELAIEFSLDLIETHDYDQAPYSQRELMRTFCDTLSTMAVKVAGPVVVMHSLCRFAYDISDPCFFVCRPQDIREWRLDAYQFNHAKGPRELITRMWRAVQRRTFGHKPSHRSILLRTRVNLHNGKTSTTYALQMLGAANIQLVQDNPGPVGPFSIVIFNIFCLDALKIDEKDIPAPHWTSILAHLTLPVLERVRLETDGVDATVLGKFLLRHPKVHTFKYHSWESPGREHSSPPIRPRIAHPSLARIEGHGPESIRLVLECLNMSPNLDTFVFQYAHSASINLLALNPAFRLLSERSARSAHLQLCIYEHGRRVSGDPGTWCLVDGETADIARSLHCLRTIEMMCWSVEMVLETLPWLVLLPGIEHVRVILCLGDESEEEGDLAEVKVKVKEALAHATVTWMQVQASGLTE